MDILTNVYVFDGRTLDKLLSQGRVPLKQIAPFPTSQDQTTTENRYVYLSYNNAVNSEFVYQGEFLSMRQYREALDSKNKLYSNGGLEIYQ